MKKRFAFFLLIPLIATLFWGAGDTSVAVAETPLASGGPDQFGYTWSDAAPFSWVDATVGSQAGFDTGTGVDEGYAGPIPIGFDFKYYENQYSQLYVSVDGLVTFGGGTMMYHNQPIPRTGKPDNSIAPFWDDLVVGGSNNDGDIYYLQGVSGGVHFLAVEWHEITRSGNNTDILTFEVILYDGGANYKICYQYTLLEGVLDSATVGIEDADGVDGIEYLSNEIGLKSLENTAALCFTRPGAGGRVKALPIYQSGFAQNGQIDFKVAFRNTGDIGTDTFDLNMNIAGNPWAISLYDASGTLPLGNTGGNSNVDTGPVAQGETVTITVRTQAPAGAQPGSYAQIELTGCSSKPSGRCTTTLSQPAIPVPFVQGYADSKLDSGLNLLMVVPQMRKTSNVTGYFTGSQMSVAVTSNGFYLFAWERDGRNFVPVDYTDLEYALLTSSGRFIRSPDKLTSHWTTTILTVDGRPVIASTQSGKIGIAFVRLMRNAQYKRNSNIYFSLLEPDGDLSSDTAWPTNPISITNNTQWRGGSDLYNIPIFDIPAIAATDDNRFVVAWEDGRLFAGGETSDIYVAVYDDEGHVVSGATPFAQSSVGGIIYYGPVLTDLTGKKAFLLYTLKDPVAGNKLAYAVLNSDGSTFQTQTLIEDSNVLESYIDTIQLSSGKILVAWIDQVLYQAHFAILGYNGASGKYEVESGPTSLPSPFSRYAGYISATRDDHGHGVLTWRDDQYWDFLYYALVDDNGSVVTPPMVFYTGQETSDPWVEASQTAFGNAWYVPEKLYLPILNR